MLHVDCNYPALRYVDLRIAEDPMPVAKILLSMGTHMRVPQYLVQTLPYPVCNGFCMMPSKPGIKHIARSDWFDENDNKRQKSTFFRNK